MGRSLSFIRQTWRGFARASSPVDEDFLIFQATAGALEAPALPDGYSIRSWKPGPASIIPPTFGLRMAAFWIFHYLRVFKSRDYQVVLIEKKGKVVHSTCVVPRYFRWPFMQNRDVQISSIWTDQSHCGQGLATLAVRHVLATTPLKAGTIWFAARKGNPASLAICGKCGFRFVGVARRLNRFGTRVLGTLAIRMKGYPLPEPSTLVLPRSAMGNSQA